MSVKRKGILTQESRNSLNCVIDERQSRTRIFKARDSLLTDLFRDKNIKSLYNVFPGIFFFTILYSALKDYQRGDRPNFGTRLIRSAFFQFDVALIIWVCMFISCVGVYFVFSFWARLRKIINAKFYWDTLFVTTYLFYILGLSYYCASVTVTNNLGAASSLAIMMEMTRLLMKSYAFVRSNSPKFLDCTRNSVCPSLSHYLYFLFAPTLIYCDVYPRTNRSIRWGVVMMGFLEIAVSVFIYSVTLENTYIYHLKDYGTINYTWLDIVTIMVECSFFGFVLLILFFFSCHSYFNSTAELMKFSDRLFYQDWWTAESIAEFFRKWSYFVYEWLHIYIYKDCHEILFPGRKDIAKIATLLLSSYFHDFILCVTSRSFLALITFEYILFLLLSKSFSNKVVLGLLGMDASVTITLFMTEYYARLNCPLTNSTILQQIAPRFLYC